VVLESLINQNNIERSQAIKKNREDRLSTTPTEHKRLTKMNSDTQHKSFARQKLKITDFFSKNYKQMTNHQFDQECQQLRTQLKGLMLKEGKTQ